MGVILCNIQSTVLCNVYLNEVQQENPKAFCSRNEKYLPRMEKLTGVCSLRGSRVTLFLFPFSADIFCWARQSKYALVWQPLWPKWKPVYVLVSMHPLNVEVIFSKNPSEIWLSDSLINKGPSELPMLMCFLNAAKLWSIFSQFDVDSILLYNILLGNWGKISSQ